MNQTVGFSPKTIAATATAYLTPIVVGWLAKQIGVAIDADTVTTFVGPLVLAAVTFVATYFAKAGVVVDPAVYPDPDTGSNPPVKG